MLGLARQPDDDRQVRSLRVRGCARQDQRQQQQDPDSHAIPTARL